jgi:REP element-mobilizing transposase RayT
MFGQPYEEPDVGLERFEASLLIHPPVKLTPPQRERCEAAIRETCMYRAWTLHAVNARTNHVHVVLSGPATPERIMEALKAWCTRQMRTAGLIAREVKPWARHGSTRYLWTPEHLAQACDYVERVQDDPFMP